MPAESTSPEVDSTESPDVFREIISGSCGHLRFDLVSNYATVKLTIEGTFESKQLRIELTGQPGGLTVEHPDFPDGHNPFGQSEQINRLRVAEAQLREAKVLALEANAQLSARLFEKAVAAAGSVS